MTTFKSLTQESLQAEMDEWAAGVDISASLDSVYAARQCALIAAKARRAGFVIKNPFSMSAPITTP